MLFRSVQHYAGYGTLLLLTVLRLFNIKMIRTVIGLALIAGSMNLIQFTHAMMTVNLNWTPMGNNLTGIKFNPLCAVLFLFLIIANFSDFMALIKYLFSGD